MEDLLKKVGMNQDELNDIVLGGICPAICNECGNICNHEPDQDNGFCEKCKTNNMVSILKLGGII